MLQCLCSLKHNLYSLVLSEINWLNFQYNLLISLDLSEIVDWKIIQLIEYIHTRNYIQHAF